MTSRASSLLLLNSYGKDEEDDIGGAEETADTISAEEATISTTATTTNFSLVGYEHDEDEEYATTQENLGRAVLNTPRPQQPEVATPPPPSPPHNTESPPRESDVVSPIPSAESLVTSSLRGVTIHASPFRCETYLYNQYKSTSTLIPHNFLKPEPIEPVQTSLQERVVRFFAFKSEGKNINDIRNSKQYKNPDILEKLVQHCGINEIGSNYPIELFDPFSFQPSDYYDSIAIEQRKLEEKRAEDRTGNRSI